MNDPEPQLQNTLYRKVTRAKRRLTRTRHMLYRIGAPFAADDRAGKGRADAVKHVPGPREAPLGPRDLPVQRVSQLRFRVVHVLLRRLIMQGASNSVEAAACTIRISGTGAVVAMVSTRFRLRSSRFR